MVAKKKMAGFRLVCSKMNKIDDEFHFILQVPPPKTHSKLLLTDLSKPLFVKSNKNKPKKKAN